MQKLKVLYDYSQAHRPDKTGIPVFVEELYNALAKECSTKDIVIEKSFDVSKFIPRRPHKFFRFFERILYHDIYLPLKLTWGHYDFYIENNYMFTPMIRPKHTLVVNVVYDIGQILFDHIHTKKNTKRWRRRFRKSIKNTDVIITISKASRNDIATYLAEEHINHLLALEYIYADAPTPKSYPSPDEIKSCLQKFNITKPFFLFLGTLEPRKNPLNLVKAFRKFKLDSKSDIILVFAGKKGWLYEDVLEYIDRYQLKDDIIFTGFVTEEEKNVLLQEMTTFVFPSLYEGFGIPPLEALKRQKTVVVSDIPVFRELFETSVLYADPYDVDHLAKQLENSLSHPPQIDKSILEKFSWKDSANKLIDILTEIKKKRKRGVQQWKK